MATKLAWLATISTHSPASTARMWMGVGDLAFGGQTYKGVEGPNGFGMSVGVMHAGTIIPDERLTLTVAASTTTAWEFFREDRGPMSCRVEWIVSRDDGATWQSTGRSVDGRISNADCDPEQRLWSAEIETVGGVEFTVPERWDDSSQRKRHPGDKGFEYAAALASGQELRWP